MLSTLSLLDWQSWGLISVRKRKQYSDDANLKESTDSEEEEETAFENSHFQEAEHNDLEAGSEIKAKNSDSGSTKITQQRELNSY